MKTLVESINESLRLDEARGWSAGCPKYKSNIDNRDEVGDYAMKLGEALNGAKPAQVKKVFGVDGQDLKNYCAAIRVIGDWWNSMADAAYNDEDSAAEIKMFFDDWGNDDFYGIVENIIENLEDESDFKVKDDEEAEEIVLNIIKEENWDKLIKELTGINW